MINPSGKRWKWKNHHAAMITEQKVTEAHSLQFSNDAFSFGFVEFSVPNRLVNVVSDSYGCIGLLSGATGRILLIDQPLMDRIEGNKSDHAL